ncbi:hypothetical protein ACN6QF_17080, partial [Acinetobacter baumannii]
QPDDGIPDELVGLVGSEMCIRDSSNTAQTSGISTIMKVNINNQSKYAGGVDPRREGIVLGNGAL